MYDVSIIMPVYNCERWLEESLLSIIKQDFAGSLQLCVFNDSSTDNSASIIKLFLPIFTDRGISVKFINSKLKTPGGCGYAKNEAIKQSEGKYLCFFDADDVMAPERISKQFDEAVKADPFTLIGSQVKRRPKNSTARYTRWLNKLTKQQLSLQVFTANGPTIAMPTWFCSKLLFDSVEGGFCQDGKGCPEDYLFFLKLFEKHCNFIRVDYPLVIYRHHLGCTSSSVKEETIWNIRMRAIEMHVLPKWSSFTIWNAGKQGRKFFRDLSLIFKSRVVAFCDVDVKKINKGFYTYHLSENRIKPMVPIIHFSEATKPFVVCMKQDLTNGVFENNLQSLNLKEGIDYVMFS